MIIEQYCRIGGAAALLLSSSSPSLADGCLSLRVAHVEHVVDPVLKWDALQITIDPEARGTLAAFTAAHVETFIDVRLGTDHWRPRIMAPITGGTLIFNFGEAVPQLPDSLAGAVLVLCPTQP